LPKQTVFASQIGELRKKISRTRNKEKKKIFMTKELNAKQMDLKIILNRFGDNDMSEKLRKFH